MLAADAVWWFVLGWVVINWLNWSKRRVNVYPVKGYSITVMLNDEESQQNAPWVSLLDESAKIVTSRLGKDRFRVAGTAEFNGYNRDIRADRISTSC